MRNKDYSASFRQGDYSTKNTEIGVDTMDSMHMLESDGDVRKQNIRSILSKLATGTFVILIVGITAFAALCLAMLSI